MNNNICLYLHSIKNAGGAEKQICLLANYYIKNNYNVHIVTWDEQLDKSFYYLSDRIDWHKLPFKKGFINKIQRITKLIKILKKYHINFLIGFVMSGNKTIFISCLFSGTRIIAAERNSPSMYFMKYSLLQRISCFFMLYFTKNIVVQLSDFISFYPKFLHKKIVSIKNTIELKTNFARPNIFNNHKKYNMLVVSRLENQQKNILNFILAISQIYNYLDSWEITIIGDGPDKNIILDQIKKFDKHNRIEILKPNNIDISKFYIESHLFISSSKWEGTSNALLEAMSFGLPLIAFKECQGINNFIVEKYNGWLAEKYNSPNNLSLKIKEAISNEKLRKVFGYNSTKLLNKNFGINNSYKWLELIR